jgi:hypothetical protein
MFAKQRDKDSDQSGNPAQRAADPQAALPEWDAVFRTDIAALLDDELIKCSRRYGSR